MKIGIVGHGVVGKNLANTLRGTGIDVIIYDRYDEMFNSPSQKQSINCCDLVFIAVPTPRGVTGECDLSEVIHAVEWIVPPICIKSTIIPGTTHMLVQKFNKLIVFSPEYIGETPYHRTKHTAAPDLVAVGGDPDTCERFLSLFRSVLGPDPVYFQADAVTVELAKYMENCFLATKVAFVAQFYLLAQYFGANFTQLREIWVADSRIGRSHSTVTGELGFGGKCLPKDLSALLVEADRQGAPSVLLAAVQRFNESLKTPMPDDDVPAPTGDLLQDDQEQSIEH